MRWTNFFADVALNATLYENTNDFWLVDISAGVGLQMYQSMLVMAVDEQEYKSCTYDISREKF